MASGAAALLRRPEQPRVAFLELFFDLVFVLALARLSQALLEHLSWSGAFQTLVLLLALWAVWAATTRVTDRLDPHRPLIQLLVLATMFGTLMMAAATPEAFRQRGLFFAGAYSATQIGRTAVCALLLRGDQVWRAFARPLFWYCVAAAPWIAGAVVHDTARGVLWALAVAVEYVALVFGFPTPRLGRAQAGAAEFAVSSEHLAERYRQLFIIALGQLILAIGLTFSRSSFGSDQIAAVVVTFATAALLWRIYIHRAGVLLAEAIATARDPIRVIIAAVYAHLDLVAGTVAIAVGDELVILHPFGNTQPAWIALILGGPALYLLGRGTFEFAVFNRVSRSRVTGIVLLAAISPAMIFLPPLVVAIVPVLVLAAIAIFDVRHARARPAEPPSPPR
jgi:low temperature requirement protein LtrA